MKKDELGSRMKHNYENRQRYYLTRRMPVIIRLDGKAFHTYTSKLKDRFNKELIDVMNLTAIKLCEEIQGAQFAYIQSDEISILLSDYQTLVSEAWFDYNQSKVESISAAIASVTFSLNSDHIWSNQVEYPFGDSTEYQKAAYFDSRAFNIPSEEVCNYFIWRQKDAIRNSIQSLAQSLYSQKELQNKNCSQLQEMCFEKGHNWNNLPVSNKRGRGIYKLARLEEVNGNFITRTSWQIDNNIPEFTQDRLYIEKYLERVD